MNKTNIIRSMTWVVPLGAFVLIVGDFCLYYIADAATYTSAIRNFIYEWPELGVFLAGALGALWSHFFWTPGYEINASKAELMKLGYDRLVENTRKIDGVNYYCLTALGGLDSDIGSIDSSEHTSLWEAYREVLNKAREQNKTS